MLDVHACNWADQKCSAVPLLHRCTPINCSRLCIAFSLRSRKLLGASDRYNRTLLMPPAQNLGKRKRQRRKKKRNEIVISSSSDDSSSSSESNAALKPASVAGQSQPLKVKPESSSSDSDSESSSSSSSEVSDDSDSYVPLKKGQDHEEDIGMDDDEHEPISSAKKTGRRSSRTPSPPPPKVIRPTFNRADAGKPEEEDAKKVLQEKFKIFWMERVVDGFKEDLETIRKVINHPFHKVNDFDLMKRI